MNNLAQLPLDQWPASLAEEVAVLQEEPCDIERISNLRFEETFDDLDYYKAVIAVSSTGRIFALRRYRNCPVPGISIIVNKDTQKGLFSQILDVLKALDLKETSITWIRDDIERQQS